MLNATLVTLIYLPCRHKQHQSNPKTIHRYDRDPLTPLFHPDSEQTIYAEPPESVPTITSIATTERTWRHSTANILHPSIHMSFHGNKTAPLRSSPALRNGNLPLPRSESSRKHFKYRSINGLGLTREWRRTWIVPSPSQWGGIDSQEEQTFEDGEIVLHLLVHSRAGQESPHEWNF